MNFAEIEEAKAKLRKIGAQMDSGAFFELLERGERSMKVSDACAQPRKEPLGFWLMRLMRACEIESERDGRGRVGWGE